MSDTSPQPSNNQDQAGRRVLEIVDGLVREVTPKLRKDYQLSAESRFDSDLGLDSLARSELLVRIESEFDVELPADAIKVETPQALLQAIISARSQKREASSWEPFPLPETVTSTPSACTTLNEVLDWNLQQHGDRVHIYLYGDENEPQPITYKDLDQGARAIAAGLLGLGVRPGDSVALMLPSSMDYFCAFFGILYAGAVPVPIYPPVRASQLEEHLRRHGRILTSAEAVVLITVPEARAAAHLLRAEAPRIKHIETVAGISQQGTRPPTEWPNPRADDLALLQYTSGSTGDPKGVMLTHGHLLANIRAMGEWLEVTSQDVFVSWLPLYHDMGLIGAWLGSLYYAMPLVVMSPLAFLSHPLHWLRAIQRHRGTISGGPNFGFELCLRAARSGDLEGLDLSSWRAAFNGAEPVSPVTLERFWQRFGDYGLQKGALMPVYGMAEASLGLTFPRAGSGTHIDRVDRDAFTHSAMARPSDADSALAFVGCGVPLPGFEVRIVDDASRKLPERREGHIQFRGPSATSGYANNPKATNALFDGDWLCTGDRGYLVEGELFVTGRVKDVIVRGGRNIYPYELEEAVGGVSGVRKGCVAAFGSPNASTGVEELVVVAETRETDQAVLPDMEQAVRESVIDVVNIPPDVIRLVPPHSVLKTSSGKIRRAATRQRFQTGTLGAKPAAVWWQIARLGVATLNARSKGLVRKLGEWFYAIYAWAVFTIMVIPAWLLVALLPRRQWRWLAVRIAARVAALLAGIRIDLRGRDNLPTDGGYVLVANHASYLDALLLTATLPHDYSYLAKRELLHNFFARIGLQRLGGLFVERTDAKRATEDTESVIAAANAGERLGVFPEGGMRSGAGLRPFRMGAFMASANSGLPVVPVAIRGTRKILGNDQWFPRLGRVQIAIGSCITPSGSGWEAALELRNRSRDFILAHCGEPDVAEG